MGSIGTPEILLVLALALLLFGPKRLPDLAKSLGRAIAEFKKASTDMRQTIEKEVEDLKQQESSQARSVSVDQSSLNESSQVHGTNSGAGGTEEKS